MSGSDWLEVFRRQDGLWDWRHKAANGMITATSGGQGFENHTDAIDAAEREHPDVRLADEAVAGHD